VWTGVRGVWRRASGSAEPASQPVLPRIAELDDVSFPGDGLLSPRWLGRGCALRATLPAPQVHGVPEAEQGHRRQRERSEETSGDQGEHQSPEGRQHQAVRREAYCWQPGRRAAPRSPFVAFQDALDLFPDPLVRQRTHSCSRPTSTPDWMCRHHRLWQCARAAARCRESGSSARSQATRPRAVCRGRVAQNRAGLRATCSCQAGSWRSRSPR